LIISVLLYSTSHNTTISNAYLHAMNETHTIPVHQNKSVK